MTEKCLDGVLRSKGEKPHRCWLPGMWTQADHQIYPGAVWECSCGIRYELNQEYEWRVK